MSGLFENYKEFQESKIVIDPLPLNPHHMKHIEDLLTLIPIVFFALSIIGAFIAGYVLCRMKKDDITDGTYYQQSERPFIDNLNN